MTNLVHEMIWILGCRVKLIFGIFNQVLVNNFLNIVTIK